MTQAVQEDVTQDGLPVTREARQAYYAAIHKASGGVVQTPQDLRDYTYLAKGDLTEAGDI